VRHLLAGSGFQREPDRLQYRIKVLENLVVPAAQNTKALSVQPVGPGFVLLANEPMLAAVQLNDDLALEADEIDDELANGSLPSKPKAAELLAAQVRPEPLLGVGQVLSQFASKVVVH
jgi:hypothetical protein